VDVLVRREQELAVLGEHPPDEAVAVDVDRTAEDPLEQVLDRRRVPELVDRRGPVQGGAVEGRLAEGGIDPAVGADHALAPEVCMQRARDRIDPFPLDGVAEVQVSVRGPVVPDAIGVEPVRRFEGPLDRHHMPFARMSRR
jgi:hypothetical protein